MRRYLDHAASSPMRPGARSAFFEALDEFANPASIHSDGQRSKQRLEEAREVIAQEFGVTPIEVIFTSGGTESVNLALKGLVGAHPSTIIVPGGEHHATMDAVTALEKARMVTPVWTPLHGDGTIDVDALAQAIDAATRPASDGGERSPALVTALAVNNETGMVNDWRRIAEEAADRGIPSHIDAVAALSHLDLSESRATTMSVSAHKIGGPVGIGALIVDRNAKLDAQIHGGGQQRGMRSGTQNTAAAVGFAAALVEARANRDEEQREHARLFDKLVAGVLQIEGARLSGGVEPRIHEIAHFTFDGAQGDSLLFLLDLAGISVSTGSACQAGVPETSHVLLAMGYGEERAAGAIRMSLGWNSTDADIDALLAALPDAADRARAAGRSDRVVAVR